PVEEVDIGMRTLLRGAKPPQVFAIIPGDEIVDFLTGIPNSRLFPNHDLLEPRNITLRDVYAAGLEGSNHLIRFASYLSAIADVAEHVRPGEFESDMLSMIAGFRTSLNPFLSDNRYIKPVKNWLAKVTIEAMERDLREAGSPEAVFALLRLLLH